MMKAIRLPLRFVAKIHALYGRQYGHLYKGDPPHTMAVMLIRRVREVLLK